MAEGSDDKSTDERKVIDRRTMLNRLTALGIGLVGLRLLSDGQLQRVLQSAEREPDVASALSKNSGDRVVVSNGNATDLDPNASPEAIPAMGELVISPDTRRDNRVPPGQRLTTGFPITGAGPIQRIDPAHWTFSITGLVEEERTLPFEDFVSLEHVKVLSDIHCVTTWSRLDNVWEGISTKTIKEIVNILPEARFVMVHAAGGFTANLPLEDFFEEDVLFALKHNDQELTPEHGYPVRLVVPRLYFWKSAKWVTGIEFIPEDKPGYWESLGYHIRGDPWKEERYSG
jgi:DMSO/TMAO reductase YedYZ molybdopterin-dependent catalytic subunit